MAERGSGLGVIAEPYWIPPGHPCWAVSRCGRVAITWRMTDEPVPCLRLEAGDGFVAVRWGHVVIVGMYISPATDVPGYERFLDDLKDCLGKFLPGQQVLMAGDFNAKSVTWGSPTTDKKGGILTDWAASLGLVCINTGGVQTCVRQRGGLLWI
ncbi:uncharacterized protein [Temnothorax longispinosus]|uniref:uncharacterized protein n=1 Tax=Temnothorax longispinosus TaxID=300112 RepID=UPI003A995AE2